MIQSNYLVLLSVLLVILYSRRQLLIYRERQVSSDPSLNAKQRIDGHHRLIESSPRNMDAYQRLESRIRGHGVWIDWSRSFAATGNRA